MDREHCKKGKLQAILLWIEAEKFLIIFILADQIQQGWSIKNSWDYSKEAKLVYLTLEKCYSPHKENKGENASSIDAEEKKHLINATHSWFFKSQNYE